nr:hypothetical protein [Tanacetum cinerariifolium]
MSKLDRFLTSKSFHEDFPHVTGIVLEKGNPDYRPILLKEIKVDYGPTPFRFYHSWLEMDGFRDMIDKGNVTENELLLQRDSLKILGDINRLEANDIAQKAKVKWAIDGDENTNFFHGMLNKKRRQLAIAGVFKDGVWIKEPFSVKAEFLDHFRKILQCSNGVTPSLDGDMPNCLSPTQSPDGFTFKFVTTFWDLIEDDVIRFVQEFYHFSYFPKGCNSSFIALIPKISNAKFVSDFRPISLIGCQYKIIGKILANRLSKIFGCLRNARASVLVNESPTCEFDIQRGLRQGAPLSPFLFILAMEGLHVLTCKAKTTGLFKGVSISNGNDSISISHLMYADDVIFLGIGVSQEEVSDMANTIGCDAATFPLKYIGVPVGCNMARCSYWNDILLKKIGNGASCHFWKDIWCDNQPLKVQFPRIFQLELEKNCFIDDRISSVDWHNVFRRPPRGGAELGYSVASARTLIDSSTLDVDPKATRWNRFIPNKVNVFIWRLMLNKLPTRVNLDIRDIDVGSLLCPICLEDLETVNHIFFSCNMAKDLWSLFAKWWEIDISVCANAMEWFEWLDGLAITTKVRSYSEGFCWRIGLDRNVFLHVIRTQLLSSNGCDQSGETMIGAFVNFYLSDSNAFMHSSLKSKSKSFLKSYVIGREILEKSFINLR